jgi:hypothetical protein
MPVAIIAAVISINAFLYFSVHGQTYVHIDAIAHVNKARGLVDNFELGLRNLGTVWLPLPHLLAAVCRDRCAVAYWCSRQSDQRVLFHRNEFVPVSNRIHLDWFADHGLGGIHAVRPQSTTHLFLHDS